MAEVLIEHVGKVYEGGVEAVKDCNIEVKDKEFVVFVGPSGCGKSTTLRMIAGLEEITSGEIKIDGKVVNDIPPKDRDIAMVFQNYALYPHMTVYENMAFGLKIRKFPKDEIDQRVRAAAKILDIEEYLDRKPKALSGGQRQRVAVGRAIVRQPKVFLFDEPLSNLDAKLRVQMRAEISALHSRLQATMIYVTHDQVEAMTMADKIVVMKLGVVQQIGTPMELYNNPVNKFVAGFIGTPPMNFIDVDIAKINEKLVAKTNSFTLVLTDVQQKALKSYVGKQVTMGVRPSDLSYAAKAEEGKTISGTVCVVEPLGSETNVFTEVNGTKMTSTVDPTVSVKVGDSFSLEPAMSKVKFFDKETEAVIN